MIRFAREYKSLLILQQAAAKLGPPPEKEQPVTQLFALGELGI
jgi:hypothetical protein